VTTHVRVRRHIQARHYAAAQSRETTSPTRKDHEAEAAGANSTARVPPRARTLVKGLVAGKYKKGKLLGAGVYGEVHLGHHINNKDELVAIKQESSTAKRQQLQHEYEIMATLSGGAAVPAVKWHGSEGDYNYLVMDLLGPNLEELFLFCNRKLSLKTVLMLADQMISHLEYIHRKGIVHRDIKPDNFMMGTGKNTNKVYLIDFGLADKFQNCFTAEHQPYEENQYLMTNPRFASLTAHQGIRQSRRDDMESLGLMLICLLKGSLPWQQAWHQRKNEPRHKHQKEKQFIHEMKLRTPIETLCQGLPSEFLQYLTECRALEYTQVPDYAGMRGLFLQLFQKGGYQYDFLYDWTLRAKTLQASISERSAA